MRRISFLLPLYGLLRPSSAYGDGASVLLTCGGVDDTAALSNALSLVCPAGGELVIAPGTCLVSPVPTPFNTCSNLTIRGAGRKTVVKVKNGSGGYQYIFGSTDPNGISNIVFKDLAVDQNPEGNPTNPPTDGELHVIDFAGVGQPTTVSGITISGMYFDPTNAYHTIHLTNNGTLRATVTNNYFNFAKRSAGATYANTAVFLEGSQQVVSGNTFFSTLSPYQGAGTAVETHGGRSTVSNNTSNYYATLVNVVPTAAGQTELNPNDVAIAGNSITCAQNGITLSGSAGTTRTLRNVTITGNAIHVCNGDRLTQLGSNPTIFTGVRYDASVATGDVDGVVVANNVVAMQSQSAGYTSNSAVSNGGILLYPAGNLYNVLVTGNIVTNAPVSGVRVGSSSGVAQRVRVVDNTIVDAGNNASLTGSDAIYRHALGVFGTANDVDVMRNMVYDTGAPNGLYSLYLSQSSTSTIRTSQNTVRIAGNGSLRTFQNSNPGVVDATNANDVLISDIAGSSGVPQTADFMSFTRYITTIRGNSSSPLTLNVPSPPFLPSTYTNWMVGQLVTFRFSCNNTQPGGCFVNFGSTADAAYGGVCEANCGIPSLPSMNIPSGKGRAITFEVDSFATSGRRFYELYRTPSPGVDN